MASITKICTVCGSEFETEEVELLGRRLCFQLACEPCIESEMKRQAEEAEAREIADREREFWELMPKIYQTTEEARISPPLRRAIFEWQYGPIGLGFRGPSGTQKTRAAALLLHRLHKGGKSVYYLKATNLTKNALEAFSDDRGVKRSASESLTRAIRCQVLLLDDIGKGRLSQTAEEMLYTILYTRTENQLPTIWTTNADASQLHDMMTEDRGDAIIRRLVEFSKIITIK